MEEPIAQTTLTGQMLILSRVEIESPKSKKSEVALNGSSNLLAQTGCDSLETSAYRLTFISLKVWEI